jgi:hypothetical protein
MARSDILRGPAIILFEGATFYSKGDITVEESSTFFAVENSIHGKLEDRPDQISHRLSFTPDGRWQDLSVLFPYATQLIGTSVFGTDKELTIWTHDGKKRVYKAAAVTKMPNLILASTQTLLTDVQFTCVHAEESDWDDANSLFTDSTEAFVGDVNYDPRDILTQPYDLAWLEAKAFTAVAATDLCSATGHKFISGTRVRLTTTGTLPAGLAPLTDYFVRDADLTAGTLKLAATLGGAAIDITDTGTGTHTITSRAWSSFRSKEGVSVEFNLSLQPETNDHKGLFDMTFMNLEVVARLQPEGVLPADVSTALVHQGAGAVRGRSMQGFGSHLNITGTGVYVRLYHAAARLGNQAFGMATRRVGQMEFASTRNLTAGVADPLFFVGTAAPA